jgi:hypothetical protein
MHILAPRPADSNLPIFFNLDSSVGSKGSNNSAEDILLVQFLLRQIAETVPSSSPAGELRRKRILNVPMSGAADPLTIDGIRAWQEARKESIHGTIVDGLVSQARGYIYGAGEWTIVDLNAIFRKTFRDIWPRLDRHPACPGLLRSRVIQVL